MQIKPKILQGLKPKIAYITGVKNTINLFFSFQFFVIFLIFQFFLICFI